MERHEDYSNDVIDGLTKLHVHMCISIAPKYSVSTIVGYLKGKSAIAIARHFGRGKNFTGEVFRARGYFVSTVGLDEATVSGLTYAIRNEKTNDTTR